VNNSILNELDSVEISLKSFKLLKILLNENPRLKKILKTSDNYEDVLLNMKKWALFELKKNIYAQKFYEEEDCDKINCFKHLSKKDLATIRILDYIKHSGEIYIDMNLGGEYAVTNPFKFLWLAVNKGTGGAKPDFFIDMIELFRQFRGLKSFKRTNKKKVENWMKRYYTGLNKTIIKQREKNRERIIKVLIKNIDKRRLMNTKYKFTKNMKYSDKYKQVVKWWDDWRFHLHFAARSPEEINEMLDNSLDPDTIKLLNRAKNKGIPFFVNPYYLSLLQIEGKGVSFGSDLAIRSYVIYSEKLIEEFGKIVAWEKEDIVKPGIPNAAGWILPSYHNIHRRYPEVAILIPDTVGRACGGLCASCQRMYDFQRGNLNFELKKLKPRVGWNTKLESLMSYFRNDSQLRDILITGGDALMSSDDSLKNILNHILKLSENKIKDNMERPDGEKFAEILRIRIGTRLLAYIPQRITSDLVKILADFKREAVKLGIKQFLIQTHIESSMEITPEMKNSVEKILDSGWMVTNQHVFTVASSRRGHNAKLRKSLLEIGILPYYTFTVKGYMENYSNFAPNARMVQEIIEEKYLGKPKSDLFFYSTKLSYDPHFLLKHMKKFKKEKGLPFLATDRSILNLPGVGKSMTFRVVGITRYGRRILEFDHDTTRKHSPIIKKIGKIIIIESKSISEYLKQLEEIGEEVSDYNGIYTYSASVTEKRVTVFDYPEYDFKITDRLTNLKID